MKVVTTKIIKPYAPTVPSWMAGVVALGTCVLLSGLLLSIVGGAYIFTSNTPTTTQATTTTTTTTTTDPCLAGLCIKNYLESCTVTGDCKTNLYLVCLNGICNCSETYYWNNQKCVPRKSESNLCTVDYQCLSPMICSSGKCKCPQLQYYDSVSKQCYAQKLVNSTCSTTGECRSDLGLQCTGNMCQCIASAPLWFSSLNKCVSIKSYGLTCNTDSECDSSKQLICNNGGVCNCPLYSKSGMCDCVRSSGNETYWNGTSCAPALSQGSSCSNSTTPFMCQTLTQGTVCNNTGGSYKCECPYLQYYDTSNVKCVSQSSINTTCSQLDACRVDQKLLCQSGICVCNSTYQFWSSSSQTCINYRNYTETCSNSQECDANLNLICNSGANCNCPSTSSSGKCDCIRVSGNESYWNGTSCVSALLFNSSCTSSSSSYMCQTLAQNTICNNTSNSYLCECPYLNYYDTTLNKCKSQLSINGTCSQPNSCRLDQGLLCQSGICSCTGTQYWSSSSQSCVILGGYSTTCTSNSECNTFLNLTCNNATSTCNCPQTLTTGKCDCTRYVGNENFWNGSTCMSALSFSQSCSSSSTSYMCKTLTENTVCNNTSGNFKCECGYLKYFDLSTSNCTSLLTYNQSCNQSNACRSDLGLLCNGTCICNNTYQFWSSSSSTCINYKNYTQTCTSNSECNSKLTLVCNNGSYSCNCPTASPNNSCDCMRVSGNELFWNGTSCTTALLVGSSCTGTAYNYMCQTLTQSSVCNSSSGSFKCECPYFTYYDIANTKCLNQLTYNGSCTQSNACRLDLGLLCINGTCLCNSTYQMWSSTLLSCVNYYSYSQSCLSTSECDYRLNLKCNSGGSTCNCPQALGNGKCDCPRTIGNEMYWNGSSCVPARSYMQTCTANANYTCKTLTEFTMCNASGLCTCGDVSYSGFNTTVSKCVYCDPAWDYVAGYCLLYMTNQSPSSELGTSSNIQSKCGRPDARLIKANTPELFSYLVALTDQSYVDATYVSPSKFVSYDGTWVINSTYICSGSAGCVLWDKDCFRTSSCGNSRRFTCQYRP